MVKVTLSTVVVPVRNQEGQMELDCGSSVQKEGFLVQRRVGSAPITGHPIYKTGVICGFAQDHETHSFRTVVWWYPMQDCTMEDGANLELIGEGPRPIFDIQEEPKNVLILSCLMRRPSRF